MKLRALLFIGLILFFSSTLILSAVPMITSPGDTILYLPFNGNTKDAGPLKIRNDANGEFVFAKGVKGEAAFFNGEDNSLKFDPVEQLHLTETFSISFWFKFSETPVFKEKQERHILRLEQDTMRWGAGFSLALEGSQDTVKFASIFNSEGRGSFGGTNSMKMYPEAWYRSVMTRSPKICSYLLLDEAGVPISFNHGGSNTIPGYKQLQFLLGGVPKDGLHERLVPVKLSFKGYLDEFVILANTIDTESLFKEVWNSHSAEDLKPFLDCQTEDFSDYGQYGVNNSLNPLKYINMLLNKEPLNPVYYSAKWGFYKTKQQKSQYQDILQKEINIVLNDCPESEKNLNIALEGYRLLGHKSTIKALEERIIREYPESALAQRRRILANNPMLKVIEPKPWKSIKDTLFADLKIGMSVKDTPEDELDPDYVLMGINAIAVNENGHIFASSRETFQISHYDENGKFVRSYDGRGELRDYLSALRAFRVNDEGHLIGLTTKKDTSLFWMLTIPEGKFKLLGRNDDKGRLYKVMAHPDGYWASSKYMTGIYDYSADIKGKDLLSYKQEDTMMDLYKLNTRLGKLEIDSVWSGIPVITDGGTLQGRYDHFTLCSLNDASYDFDREGNIYLAHRFLPRFRKFTKSGELVYDFEFNFYGTGAVRPGIGLGNGYRLMSCFQAVRTTDSGSCLLYRHGIIDFIDPHGKVINTVKLAGLKSEKARNFWFIASNSYGNKHFIMEKDGSYLYGVSGRNTIYRYKLPKF